MVIASSWGATDANNTAYANAKKAFNYYAYYPYQVGVTDPGSVVMTVKSDQSTAAAADYNASDALTARNKTVALNSTNVTLQFTHAFALVQVNLEGTMADKDATVTMQNVFPGAALNLQYADGALAAGSANGTQGNIKMYSLPEVNQVADADVNGGINIMLYNYSTGASTVYIKDLKLEKYVAAP